MDISGVWLPLITPMVNDEIDYESYISMINYYIGKNISGLIPLGTTGEGPAVDEYEMEKIIDTTINIVNHRVPVFFGLSGNITRKVTKQIMFYEKYDFNGFLSVVPYYNKPDQRGLYNHFKNISLSTDKKIIIYNIPHRTGINLENNTLLRLSEIKNIIGVKDSSGNIKQSMELLLNKPDNFYVLTGEDIMYFLILSLGGDGGILASAHIETDKFVKIFKMIKDNNHIDALKIWKPLCPMIELLFCEPNPAPLKYALKTIGLIREDSTRSPIMGISNKLKVEIDKYLAG
jgi:4-hydroxy-tetrahydrodipicolinate synthase